MKKDFQFIILAIRAKDICALKTPVICVLLFILYYFPWQIRNSGGLLPLSYTAMVYLANLVFPKLLLK